MIDKYLCESADAEIRNGGAPRYNIAPSQDVVVVRKKGDQGRALTMMKWGLVPSWSKSSTVKFNTVNARAEGLKQSLVYKEPFRRTRCVVPADGFFEWKATSSPKQPYYIYPSERGELFSFAALYDEWRNVEGEVLNSFSIVTTAANEAMEKIHHRMPVILDDDAVANWLSDGSQLEGGLDELLMPSPNDQLEMHGVSTRVNKVTCDVPEVLEPFEPLEWDF